MNYCFRYFRPNRNLHLADEIIIKYEEYQPTIIEFCNNEHYKDKKIIVNISENIDEVDLANSFALFNECPNISLMLHKQYVTDMTIDRIKHLGIPFFFDIYANNIDMLYSLANFGVSEIYITGELGFMMNVIEKYKNEYNIKIRACANVRQADPFNEVPAIKSFFIRPEDIEFYSKYIDTIEFYGPVDKQDIFYDIYAKDKSWIGKLSDIIYDSDIELFNDRIEPYFSTTRSNCNKVCLTRNACHYCDRVLGLGEKLFEAGLYVDYKPIKEVDKHNTLEEKRAALIEKIGLDIITEDFTTDDAEDK